MSDKEPAALLRAMMGEWIGGGKPGGALRGMADQAMAAANLPTKAEVEALSARLGAVEAAILRLEARLDEAGAKKRKK